MIGCVVGTVCPIKVNNMNYEKHPIYQVSLHLSLGYFTLPVLVHR